MHQNSFPHWLMTALTMQAIPATPWFIIADVNKAEIFADWPFYSPLMLGLILAVLVAVGIAAGVIWQRIQKVRYQALYLSEKARQESEMRYHTTLLCIGDGVIATDIEGQVVQLNPAAEALTGWSHSEASGKAHETVFCIIDEATLQPVESPVHQAVREGVMVGLSDHILLITKNGRKISIAGSSAPTFDADGFPNGTVLAFRNQGGTRAGQEALQESEAYIRTVLDNLPVGVAVNSVDPAVEFSYMNDNFVRYYRTTREALANPDTFWEAVYEDVEFRETIRKRVLEDIASGDAERMCWDDVPITRKGAATTFISARNTPIHGKKLMLSTVWDTTERKRAEEELYKLSWAVEQNPSIIYITDPDGRLEYVNPKFTEITGYTSEEALGRLPRILDPDKLPSEEYEERCNTIRAGHEWRGEFHNRKKNGESFWETASISSIKDAAGSITHFVIVIEDITARKQAEDALRVSEERFRVVAESAPDAIISIDSHGKIIFWNRVAERIFGYSVEEAIGTTSTMIMPERVRQTHQDSIWQFLSTGQSSVVNKTIEMVGLRRDGTEFPLELSLAHWQSNGEAFFTAIIRDITGRKQAEQELRNLNEELEQRVTDRTIELNRAIDRIEAILNSSNDIVILCRTNGTINQVNPAFDKAFGHIPDEAFNQRLTQFVVPEQARVLEQTFETVVQSGQPERLEIIARYKESPPFDADVVLSPVVGSDNRLFGVICSLRDVTRQKQMEAQLRQLLTHEMELNELKSRYVSMAAHDLRNPLAVIQTTIDLIHQYSDRLTGEKLQEKYDHIQASIKVMVNMLDDILTLGKVESGKLGFEPAHLDVIAFCKDIVGEMKQATGTPQPIDFSSQGDCSITWLDTKLLRHILGNLLSNAIKYSSEDRPVIFTVHCAPNQIIFHVQDHGIGIPEDDQKQLFEAFHRASNARQLPGTGLGLAIVKQSVDLHGGTITFESQEGIGTTFIVTLPQAGSGD